MKNLKYKTHCFIDDERFPPKDGLDWNIVRSFKEFFEVYPLCAPDVISFDHDLGVQEDGTEASGYDIVKAIIDRDIELSGGYLPPDFKFCIHSMNPIGGDNIKLMLERYLSFKKE